MALCKTIDTDFGTPATYWNIGAYQEDYKGKGAQVTLYGYVNKAAREGGKQPLAAAKVDLTGDLYTSDATRDSLYSVLKAMPEWAGSDDC